MAQKFEQHKPRAEPKARRDIHDARWHTRGDRPMAETADARAADATLAEIYKDKTRFDAYKKVGAHLYGADEFMGMIEKWEKDEGLSSEERDMREQTRGEFVNRMGLVNACQKLMTTSLFRGIRDHDHPVNQVVGSVGEEWALKLIAPRLIKHVGEANGTESLMELHTALRDFHGVYQTRGFNSVYNRIEKYRDRYGITPEKWAGVQRGGSLLDTAGRAYGEFAKQHSFLGKAWYMVPNYARSLKIGFAGWREEKNANMQNLRGARTRALEVLGHVLDEDFLQLVDKAAKTDKPKEVETASKARDAAEQQAARGMSEADITTTRDAEWATHAATLGGTPTQDQYENWTENTFKPAYEAHTSGQGGILMSILRALFSIRLGKLPLPAGVTPRPTP